MSKKIKKRIILILFILIIVTFGGSIAYSFFQSAATMDSSDQHIAKFVFNAQITDQLQLPLVDLQPGSKQDFNFEIKNNEAEKLSDVSIDYQLTIKTFHFVPTTIKLYKVLDGQETLILNCDESYSRNDNNELVCNTDTIVLDYQTKKNDLYKLTVEFPAEYSDKIYADLVDYVNITVKSWQKLEE